MQRLNKNILIVKLVYWEDLVFAKVTIHGYRRALHTNKSYNSDISPLVGAGIGIIAYNNLAKGQRKRR